MLPQPQHLPAHFSTCPTSILHVLAAAKRTTKWMKALETPQALLVGGLQGARLLISLFTVLEKHQLGEFVSQVVTQNSLGGHGISWETLRGSSTGKLVEVWLGLNQ